MGEPCSITEFFKLPDPIDHTEEITYKLINENAITGKLSKAANKFSCGMVDAGNDGIYDSEGNNILGWILSVALTDPAQAGMIAHKYAMEFTNEYVMDNYADLKEAYIDEEF